MKEKEKEREVVVVSSSEETELKKLVDYFNNNTTFDKISGLTDRQRAMLKYAIVTLGSDNIQKCFQMATESSFLSGRKNSDWHANFDWLINTDNIRKVISGKYADYKYNNNQSNINHDSNERNIVSSFDADEFLEAALTRSFD